jgi:hypothetical protein
MWHLSHFAEISGKDLVRRAAWSRGPYTAPALVETRWIDRLGTLVESFAASTTILGLN